MVLNLVKSKPEYNDYYVYPEKESLQEEEEFAFEGTRFYDLMRVALRRNAPSYLANKIYARKGKGNEAEVRSLIQTDLNDTHNWYLNWDGKIGLGQLFNSEK